MAGASSFFVTFATNAVIAIVCMLLFSYLRPKFPLTFSPRSTFVGEQHAPTLPSGFLGWIRPLWDYSEVWLIGHVGVDAVMYLRFCFFAAKLFLLMSVICIVLVVPFNCLGDNSDGDDGLDFVSMAHVDQGSQLLWGHVVALWVLTLFVMHQLKEQYASFLYLRTLYLRQPLPNHKCCIVQDIPEPYQTDNNFRAFFKDLYGNLVERTSMARDVSKLEDMVLKRNEEIYKLEHAVAVYSIDKERPQHKVKPIIGPKVDSISYHQDEVRKHSKAEELMRQYQHPVTPSGFVEFTTLSAKNSAVLDIATSEAYNWTISPAPEYRDVLWKNLKLGHRDRFIRERMTEGITFAIVFFSVIPITFISSLTTLTNLESQLPFLEPVLEANAAVKGFLEGLLPSLALLIFLALLPGMLMALSKFQGVVSGTDAEQGQMTKFYTFQIFNVFLAFTVSGVILSILDEIANEPAKIIDILGTSLPGVATTYINYVLLQAFGQFPIQMLRIGPLVVSWAKKKWLAKTPREIRAADEPGPFTYGVFYAKHLLVVMIGMTYSVINPIILPFCSIYFLLAYFTHRYQLIYVNVASNEGGGMMFPLVFARILVGLFLCQLTMIGLFSLKAAVAQAPFLIPLPVMTVIFYMYCNKTFYQRTIHLPMKEAREADVVSSGNDNDKVTAEDNSPSPGDSQVGRSMTEQQGTAAKKQKQKEKAHGDKGDVSGTLYLAPCLANLDLPISEGMEVYLSAEPLLGDHKGANDNQI